jgi:hypothetical protein
MKDGKTVDLLHCTLGWVDFWLFLHFQQKYPWDLLYTFQKYRK